jgi:hypothetical protein
MNLPPSSLSRPIIDENSIKPIEFFSEQLLLFVVFERSFDHSSDYASVSKFNDAQELICDTPGQFPSPARGDLHNQTRQSKLPAVKHSCESTDLSGLCVIAFTIHPTRDLLGQLRGPLGDAGKSVSGYNAKLLNFVTGEAR